MAARLGFVLSFVVLGLTLGLERSEGVTHTVGDSTGWGVPRNSDFYDDWADRQVFRVGDRLSFNWTGMQNVVEVTEQRHDDCVKVTNNVITTSPAVFDLTTIGKRYFISTIGNQCNFGQELEIEVIAAAAIPPPPRAVPPTPTTGSPAPRPSSTVHVVGDSTGWGVPTNSDFYDDWAERQIFRAGDQLVFNWIGTQNVVEVTEEQHDDCVKVTRNVITTSPAVFNLTTIGKRYFISTIGNQCNVGQELEIEIIAAAAIPSPPRAVPPPPTTGSPTPRPSTTIHVVGDSTGWSVPTHSDFYDDWAERKIFRVGDQLVFNWTGTQNVVEVTEEQHDDCVKVTRNVITTSPAVFNLTTIGKRYFICTIGNQCNIGQELEIEVLAAEPVTPPSTPATSPPPSTVSPAPTQSTTHSVGGSVGWRVPTNSDFYDDWAERQIFRVGDKLSFNWTGTQNVVEVTDEQHDDCVKVTSNVITTSPAVFDLTTVGKRYFICTIGNQCNIGQELEIEVIAAAGPTSPSTTPSTISLAPSSNTPITSGSASSPSNTMPSALPPSSSASFGAMVALSATLSIVVLSFLS